MSDSEEVKSILSLLSMLPETLDLIILDFIGIDSCEECLKKFINYN